MDIFKQVDITLPEDNNKRTQTMLNSALEHIANDIPAEVADYMDVPPMGSFVSFDFDNPNITFIKFDTEFTDEEWFFWWIVKHYDLLDTAAEQYKILVHSKAKSPYKYRNYRHDVGLPCEVSKANACAKVLSFLLTKCKFKFGVTLRASEPDWHYTECPAYIDMKDRTDAPVILEFLEALAKELQKLGRKDLVTVPILRYFSESLMSIYTAINFFKFTMARLK